MWLTTVRWTRDATWGLGIAIKENRTAARALRGDFWLAPKAWAESPLSRVNDKDGNAVHYVRAVITNTNKAENGNIQHAA